MKKILFLTVFAAVTATVPVYGHHSFAAYYFADQSVSIEGFVEEFDFVNPHVWLHLQAADKDGKLQKVSVEWAPPNRLAQWGIKRDFLKPGDRVIVTGSPSRDGIGFKLQLKRLIRIADGWTWNGRGELR